MKKGFTLIELLVVIAIVAVLAVVVILTLNPAELLRQARDSNRVSDMATLKSALALYLADVSSPNIGIGHACFATTSTSPVAQCGGAFALGYFTQATSSYLTTVRKIDGTGWIPIDFTSISSKSPISNLPIDPVNNATYYYAYASTSSNMTYKIVAHRMESTKYASGGSNDVVSTDGGPDNNELETGTNLSL